MKGRRYFYSPPKLLLAPHIVVISFLAIWFFITFDEWEYGGLFHLLKGLGSAIGIVGFVYFSFSLFLSSRFKKLEDWFGGLDQIYYVHHKIGLWGFYFLLLHPWVMAIKWLFHRPDKFFTFIFPIHHRLSMNLGSYAFLLMILIIGITIFKLLPYDKWKLLHRFMALVFVLASFHILLSERPFDPSYSSLILLCFPMALGLFGILYKQIYVPFFSKRPTYKVIDTKKINDNVVLITFEPEKERLNFSPGQYAFFSFQGKISKEQHPFTLCNEKGNPNISIFVKARGDFTKTLYKDVAHGLTARLEGPYGRFDFTKGRKNQIWIAGGVGIAPFIAWMEKIPQWHGEIDLFYCVHRLADAIFLEEFQKIKKQNNNFNCVLYCTERKRRLTVSQIIEAEKHLQQKDIFMCGPRRLTHPFATEFVTAGVRRKNIYFEDFEFF